MKGKIKGVFEESSIKGCAVSRYRFGRSWIGTNFWFCIWFGEPYEEEVNNEDTCQFKPISSYFLGEIWPPWVRTSNLGLIFTIFIRTKCPRWDTPRLQWEHVGPPQHNSSKNSKQNNSTAVEQNHGVPEQLFMLLYYFPELNKLSYLIWKRRV